MPKKKLRLDQLLVDRGLAQSRERAKALILAGKVVVGENAVTKAGQAVAVESPIRLKGSDCPYVSRGGLKLEGALDHFNLDPSGFACMDIGSSTGGFTDCLLKRGARIVYAFDVGKNQNMLEWKKFGYHTVHGYCRLSLSGRFRYNPFDHFDSIQYWWMGII